MTCKDCLHVDVCSKYGTTVDFDVDDGVCLYFADRSRFVEIPCRLGDTVYDIEEFFDGTTHPEMYEYKADYITFYDKFPDRKEKELWITIDGIDYTLDDFGKIVFLTRAEAEAKLKEMER